MPQPKKDLLRLVVWLGGLSKHPEVIGLTSGLDDLKQYHPEKKMLVARYKQSASCTKI